MRSHEIRLVLCNLKRFGDFHEQAESLLSDDERARAKRLQVPDAAKRFVLTRGLLRHYLGEFLKVSPESIRFVYGDQGKPALAGSSLVFNVSHSGDWAAMAFSRQRELGVDIEKIRPLRSDQLPERYFSTPEAIVYRVTPDDRREAAFFHYWTAKESFLKARGDGLSRGLGNYSFSDPWEDPPRLTWVKWDAGEPSRWTFLRFWPEEGYLGTLAYSGSPTEVNIVRDFENL